jgi:hypothetical protein
LCCRQLDRKTEMEAETQPYGALALRIWGLNGTTSGMSSYIQNALATIQQAAEEVRLAEADRARRVTLIAEQSGAYWSSLLDAVRADVDFWRNSKQQPFGLMDQDKTLWVTVGSGVATRSVVITRRENGIVISLASSTQKERFLKFAVDDNDVVQVSAGEKILSYDEVAEIIFEPLIFPNGRPTTHGQLGLSK